MVATAVGHGMVTGNQVPGPGESFDPGSVHGDDVDGTAGTGRTCASALARMNDGGDIKWQKSRDVTTLNGLRLPVRSEVNRQGQPATKLAGRRVAR
jgi:hypothetical protein